MDTMRELIKQKKLLQAGDRDTEAWAEELGLAYAFDQKGNLLASGREEAYLTEDGKLTSKIYFNGSIKEGLSGERQVIPVLYFIPSDLDVQKYDGNKNLQKKGIPLPFGYQVKNILCQNDIFCILSQTGQSEIRGSFNTMHATVGMLETLYFNRGAADYIISQCYFYYLIEDHRKYLEEQEKQSRKKVLSDGKRHTADPNDFLLSRSGDYECEYLEHLWGRDVEIYASYEGAHDDADQALADYAARLNMHMKWIEENRDMIQNMLLEDGMLELACDWMEGRELTEEGGQTWYVMDDGQLFPCPVTRQAFLDGLYIEGINASCDDDVSKEVLFDLLLGTTPDFFAYHSIEVFITATPGENGWDYEVSVNGLAG